MSIHELSVFCTCGDRFESFFFVYFNTLAYICAISDITTHKCKKSSTTKSS